MGRKEALLFVNKKKQKNFDYGGRWSGLGPIFAAAG
jgi:hypothetical protein